VRTTLWYGRAAVEGTGGIARRIVPACAVAAVLLSGCGSGEKQDANEPSGTFDVAVVDASFPERQSLAQAEELKLSVRNEGERAVPNVAVTISSFSRVSEQAGLSDPQRPVWIVDEGPAGGDTAYTNTWALGRLAAGQSRTFTWRVTAIRPGTHTVRWQVAAGLDGKAVAHGPDDRAPEGRFTVSISDKPSDARVDPDTGEVVRSSR